MDIQWNAYPPYAAIFGGVFIGVAAALFVLMTGRIAGISGVVGGLLRPRAGEVGWRIAFVAGLLIAPSFYALFRRVPEPHITTGWGTLIVAGLLVGIGTRLGSGCTSGHGVCGLSRFSLRSLVAVATFMAAAFATVYVVRHVLRT